MPDQKRKAIGVVRVSTEKQENERQLIDIENAARIHNLEIERTIPLKVSGTVMRHHPEIKQLERDLARPDIHGVVISALDRLIRPAELGDLAMFDIFQRTKKKIWTPTQEMDLTTNTGFLQSGILGVFAGFERQIFLARAAAGKMVARKRGGHPDGSCSLPEGVSCDKAGAWRYDPLHSAKILKGYDMLSHRASFREIGAALGGYAATTVRRWLKNPIWCGVRRYLEPEAYDQPVSFEGGPLITRERFDAAQEIIDAKRENWRKIPKRPRHLVASLVRCSCGKAMYLRGAGPKKHDTYYCSSRHPSGKGCGARSLRRERVDATVMRIVTEQLLSIPVLNAFLDVAQRETAPETSAELAAAISKLEAKKHKLTDYALDGLIPDAEYRERARALDREIAAARALQPAPAPALDMERLARMLVSAFTEFRFWQFEQQREFLRRAWTSIVIENGTIPRLTFNGGFLGELVGANVCPPSREATTGA